jgi:hypothetical protein
MGSARFLPSLSSNRTTIGTVSKSRVLLCLLACVVAAIASGAAQKAPTAARRITNVVPDAARPLPLTAVRLTGGPLKHAQDLDAKYLLELQPDRMLAFYRQRAGLEQKAEPYEGSSPICTPTPATRAGWRCPISSSIAPSSTRLRDTKTSCRASTATRRFPSSLDRSHVSLGEAGRQPASRRHHARTDGARRRSRAGARASTGRRERAAAATRRDPDTRRSGAPAQRLAEAHDWQANEFRSDGVGRDRDVELVPFYRLHRRTYSSYWEVLTPAEYEKKLPRWPPSVTVSDGSRKRRSSSCSLARCSRSGTSTCRAITRRWSAAT